MVRSCEQLLGRQISALIENQARAASDHQQHRGGEEKAHSLETLQDFGKFPKGQVGDLPYLPSNPSTAATITQIPMWARKP
jgi:hypothetical protein